MGGRIVDMEMKKMEEDGKTMNNETSVRIKEYLLMKGTYKIYNCDS